MNIELDEEEAGYLDDILSWWMEGYDDAKEQTIADRSIDNADDLMVLTDGLVKQHAMATEIRYRIREAINGPRD